MARPVDQKTSCAFKTFPLNLKSQEVSGLATNYNLSHFETGLQYSFILDSTPREPVIGTLISVGAPTEPPKLTVTPTVSQPTVILPPFSKKPVETVARSLKKEKKKEKKEGKKEKKKDEMKEKGSSELETDGSEAEMWADGSTVLKKKKVNQIVFV